jgi:excisionase family DNA binding protein
MSKPTIPDWIPKRLLTLAETAELVSLSYRQVLRLVHGGQLDIVRIGKCVRVRPESIARLLAENTNMITDENEQD